MDQIWATKLFNSKLTFNIFNIVNFENPLFFLHNRRKQKMMQENQYWNEIFEI
jgi:hypothetical protein